MSGQTVQRNPVGQRGARASRPAPNGIGNNQALRVIGATGSVLAVEREVAVIRAWFTGQARSHSAG
jgi:hypothetical protein